ncbi:MAG: cbb3-type cytochrome oxidase assembly protein [Phycisphaeraceae bacterium]|nr:cbb3-type cytochrome oxidase assembly protein [Phycisphaeraceae bacterium]
MAIESETNADNATPRIETTRGNRIFLWVFSTVLIITAGTAFIFKLIEFFYTATHDGTAALASFLIPVLNYLIVAAGFLCLFMWALLSGQFRDVEGPKYRMLEMQKEIDQHEAQAHV